MARGSDMKSMCSGAESLKLRGDEAFRREDFASALECYDEAVQKSAGSSAVLLCNRSVARFKAGDFEGSLEDAEEALEVLQADKKAISEESMKVSQASELTLQKALYRKGAALMELKRPEQAIESYRRGLKLAWQETPKALIRALNTTLMQPSEEVDRWLAKHWASLIEDAERPALMSSRDGKLLKPVPKQDRLSRDVMLENLYRLPVDFKPKLISAWSRGKEPGRVVLVAARSLAYLKAGDSKQSLKDAHRAVAFGSRSASSCTWPTAYVVLASAQEAEGNISQAALAIGKACNLDSSNEENAAMREKIVANLPPEQREAFVKGGVAGLEEWLEDERERNLPEYLRKRPKYYYYYEYMKKRINEIRPGLPEPVVDKLLAYDADELDLILSHPAAARDQIAEFLGIYEEHGDKYLEDYQPRMLSWEEVKALKEEKEAAQQERIAYASQPEPHGSPENARLMAAAGLTGLDGTGGSVITNSHQEPMELIIEDPGTADGGVVGGHPASCGATLADELDLDELD